MNARWLKIVGGVLLLLLGAVWIGQGLNLISGSAMTGQPQWAVAGVVAGGLGAWLCWRASR